MKEVLKRCVELAYLELGDALRLEADIHDMISMADSLSKLQDEELDVSFKVTLGNLREDKVRSDMPSKAPAFAERLCVPRIKGV